MTDTLAFLDALYRDAPTGHLAIFIPEDKRSIWFPVNRLNDMAVKAIQQAQTRTVYFNTGIHPRPPSSGGRGESAHVSAIAGLFIEIDILSPAHTKQNLPPTREDVLALLRLFPHAPSWIVSSGHGLHVWWLFKEVWAFDNDAERQEAATLARRLQRWFQAQAKERGWHIDSTMDLARVLRLPGTINRKPGLPDVQVETLHGDVSIRYNPSDFDEILPMVEEYGIAWEPRGDGKFPLVPLEPILAGCAFMRHCRDDAKALSEPEWTTMLSIVGRCKDGGQHAHELSKPYPRYDREETEQKLQHATADLLPRTCKGIRADLDAEPFCAGCPHWGKIKSPINLAPIPGGRQRGDEEAPPEDAWNDEPPIGFQKPADLTPDEILAAVDSAASESERQQLIRDLVVATAHDALDTGDARIAETPADDEPPPHDDEDAPGGKKKIKEPRLWQSWAAAVEEDRGKLIWADTEEAYISFPTGDLMALKSEKAAYYFQGRTDQEAYHGSEKWRKAAGAVSAHARNGEKIDRARVFHHASVDWDGKRAWIGCDDGRQMYRVTPEKIELVRNGADGILIIEGCAPVIEGPIAMTGALANWLVEATWATPTSRLLLAILFILMMLGARAFEARPLIVGKGGKGSGKTTSLQIAGCILFGKLSVAQAIKAKEEENESRILNERLAIFDNIDSQPYGYSVEDFLATTCTQQMRSIRKMRVEGEVVEKSITAFPAVTSYTLPPCLRRPDVMERSVILDFKKPQDGRTGRMRSRIPDRSAIWGDLLILLQRALSRWDEVPDTSEIRAIEFVQFAHALLPKESALAVEQTLLNLQLRTAATDDPILEALETNPPNRPMTAKELWAYLWPVTYGFRDEATVDPNRPKSPFALGRLLSARVGEIGGWRISGEIADTTKDRTEWTFVRISPEQQRVALSETSAAELLQQYFAPGDDDYLRAISEESPKANTTPSCACTGDTEIQVHIGDLQEEGEREAGGRGERKTKNLISTAISESPVRHERRNASLGDSSEMDSSASEIAPEMLTESPNGTDRRTLRPAVQTSWGDLPVSVVMEEARKAGAELHVRNGELRIGHDDRLPPDLLQHLLEREKAVVAVLEVESKSARRAA